MNVKDLITILQTYDGKLPIVVQTDFHVGYEQNSVIDGIEEIKYEDRLVAIKVI